MPSPRLPSRLLLVALLCTGLLLATGCAKTPEGPPPVDRYRPLLRLGVSLATDRLLTANPRLVPTVVTVSRLLVHHLDQGAVTSVHAVQAFVQAHLPWDTIDPAARPLVGVLLDAVVEELRVVVVQYQIPPDGTLLLVRELFQWVLEVAERHQAMPGAAAPVRQL